MIRAGRVLCRDGLLDCHHVMHYTTLVETLVGDLCSHDALPDKGQRTGKELTAHPSFTSQKTKKKNWPRMAILFQ